MSVRGFDCYRDWVPQCIVTNVENNKVMHELNICLSLIRLLENQLTEHHTNKNIKKIWVEVGELAGIEMDALKFSFPIAASKSVAEKAILKIIPIAGCAWCNSCKNHIVIKTFFDSCVKCGCYDFRIIRGKELRILKIEVE